MTNLSGQSDQDAYDQSELATVAVTAQMAQFKLAWKLLAKLLGTKPWHPMQRHPMQRHPMQRHPMQRHPMQRREAVIPGFVFESMLA